MGFDVTFHPIGVDQLRHFFFDVIEDQKKADSRAEKISADPKRRGVVLQLYKALPQWLAAKEQVGSSFALGAAIIAGFLHPFWYARGQALSFVAEKHVPEAADLFVRLGDVAPRLHSELPDSSRGLIKGGESASGLIPPERIEAVDRLLRRMEEMPGTGGRTLLQTAFDADGLASLRAALAYCRVKKLGMIEASDIVVPFSGESLTEIKNMRAPFLGKMAP